MRPPNVRTADTMLSDEHVATVKRLARERGVAPTAYFLGASPETIREVVTGGRLTRRTVERLAATIAKKKLGGAPCPA